MTHVMAPDERRRRLASDADLHASERYDGVATLVCTLCVVPANTLVLVAHLVTFSESQ